MLAGFWQNSDIDARRKAGVLPDDESYRGQLQSRRRRKAEDARFVSPPPISSVGFTRQAKDVGEFTGELHYAAVGFLASTPSELMVLNQEDLFKEMINRTCREQPSNIPTGATRCAIRWTSFGTIRTRKHARRCFDAGWNKPAVESVVALRIRRTELLLPRQTQKRSLTRRFNSLMISRTW